MHKCTKKYSSGGTLGVPWARFGRSWTVLGRSWALLGRSWGALGALLGTLGVLLGTLWGALGRLLEASGKKIHSDQFVDAQLDPQNGAKLEPESCKNRRPKNDTISEVIFDIF